MDFGECQIIIALLTLCAKLKQSKFSCILRILFSNIQKNLAFISTFIKSRRITICVRQYPKSSGTGYMFLKSLVNALSQKEVAVGLGMISRAVLEINEGVNLKILFFEEGAPNSLYGYGIIDGKQNRQCVKEVFDFFYNTLFVEDKELFFPIVMFSVVAFMKKYPNDTSFSLDNVIHALRLNVGQYLMNSLLIAICVSVLGVVLAVLCAYFTARMPSKYSKILHLLSITSLAIPGIVLGLSYAMFFKGSIIYGTFAMLILVNMMHFFASPYLMIYNTFNKLNANLEAVGMTLGISRWGILKDVLLPMSKGTLLEMLSYFFVNSMMTISAVSFLASVSNKPAALMITQFEGQMLLECAAFVSLLILIVNILFKGTVLIVKRYISIN